MTHHSRIRWYNPRLNTFEWREVPESNDKLNPLEGQQPATEETRRVTLYSLS